MPWDYPTTQNRSSGPSSTGPTSPIASEWYNDDHRHSGIGLHTPADVHYGRAQAIREQRGVVLLDAYGKHPERFVRKIPTPPALPAVAWINQPEQEATDSLNR
jgi:putative transposase